MLCLGGMAPGTSSSADGGGQFCAGSANMSQSCVSAKPGKSSAGLQVGLSPLGRGVGTLDPTNASAGGE